MIVLATDTSTATGSVAVCDDGGILCEAVIRYGRSHAERLLETADWVLAQSGLRLADVDLLAVSQGPGSFTGLRIGVAAWKGLAVGASLPLIGVDTLEALAHQALPWKGLIYPILDARMNEAFGALYRADGMALDRIHGPAVGPVERLLAELDGPAIALGDGVEAYEARIRETAGPSLILRAGAVPLASTIAALAMTANAAGIDADPGRVEPVYLRKSQAEEARDSATA